MGTNDSLTCHSNKTGITCFLLEGSCPRLSPLHMLASEARRFKTWLCAFQGTIQNGKGLECLS